jgi:hypothetical protein
MRSMNERNRMRGAEPEIELVPDAWKRFERAVDVVAKSPPQHRPDKRKKPAAKPAKKKGG